MKSLANFLEAYDGAQEKERRAKQIQQGKIQPTKNATPQAANTGADAVKAKQEKLAADRKAADAAGKKAAKDAVKLGKIEKEQKAAVSAEKKAREGYIKKEKEEKKPAGPSKPAEMPKVSNTSDNKPLQRQRMGDLTPKEQAKREKNNEKIP